MSARRRGAIATLLAAATLVGGATAHPFDDATDVRVSRMANGIERPCPPLKVVERDVYGGCKVDVAGGGVVFTLVSLFGDHPFAECQVRMALSFGPSGRLMVDNVEVVRVGGTEPSPCGDLRQCEADISDPTSEFPWHGRVVRADGEHATLDIDMCFDSCVGRLRGVTRIQLRLGGPTARSARIAMRRATVGYAGMEIDGEVGAHSRSGALRIDG